MMVLARKSAALLAAALVAFAISAAHAQVPATRDDIINQLSRFEGAPDIDVTSLRQQVLARSRSRSKVEAQTRSPVAPELLKLPSLLAQIQFDVDTPIVRPESYPTLGRIADALVNAALLPYGFLIVGHAEATGKRENNAILSQRRADAVRDILVNTFKISSKRLQSVGLGEEQLLDAEHPSAAINGQVQILTVAKTL
jgi:OOP family OmpA-OmpF porin